MEGWSLSSTGLISGTIEVGISRTIGRVTHRKISTWLTKGSGEQSLRPPAADAVTPGIMSEVETQR